MAYLLRTLLLTTLLGIGITAFVAHELWQLHLGHIQMAIPSFLLTMFVQAFIMFYFIGTARFVNNIQNILNNKTELDQLFEIIPTDLTPYLKRVNRFVYEANLCKRQTIPWTMLILILGMIAFFMGAAHDTGMVQKTTHSGIAYGFIFAFLIGFWKQWFYLGKTHLALRKIKQLFDIPDGSM